jgi:hypothetical protein
MSKRILTVLVAALLVGGVVTAVLKDAPSEQNVGLSVPPTVPDEPFDPGASPTETMTFDGVPPFESPATVGPTSTPTGGLPVTGRPGAWPPALAALSLAGVAALTLRRSDA